MRFKNLMSNSDRMNELFTYILRSMAIVVVTCSARQYALGTWSHRIE